MFLQWRKIIERELSGRQAYRYAERIAQYHRIQASTGYREAAQNVVQLLKRDEVNAEIISYKAMFGERHLANRTFQEWHCQSAELWLLGEERKRLARFQEEEISVVQRSIATPPVGVEAELVVVENAENPQSYQNLDLKGKIALVRGNLHIIYDLAVEKHGAIGLVFDNLNEYPPLRTRLDMPDTIQYTSFWWHGNEQKAFGFAVSPRVGEGLRTCCKQGPVYLKAIVDTKLYDGHYENIEYFIEGKKKEEILLVSHLCHPYPGGQDNASGPGTLMEVMRTLSRLIREGEIPQPELGIRFLMMPEMTGTYAYFAQHPERIPLTIAALNLDMVGADQSKGGGPLTVEQPPLATPTFVDRFAYSLLQSLSQEVTNSTGITRYSMFHYLKVRFSGGSDHYILSDPTIGIPCPMMIQWPDKHYHTTSDSPYNLDPSMMKRVGLVTALYAYGLANGNEPEWVDFLTKDVAGRFESLRESVEWRLSQKYLSDDISEAFHFYVEVEQQAYQHLRKYAECRGFDQLARKIDWALNLVNKQANLLLEWTFERTSTSLVHKVLNTEPSHPNSELEPEWKERVYRRVYQGPISLTHELERLSLEERIAWYQDLKRMNVPAGYDVYLQYWMDGKRGLQEIVQLVKLESGKYHPAFAKNYIMLCERLGLMTLVS